MVMDRQSEVAEGMGNKTIRAFEQDDAPGQAKKPHPVNPEAWVA